MKQALIVLSLLLIAFTSFSQNSVFKGHLAYPDGSMKGYGNIYFPFSKEKAEIDSTGKITIDLKNEKHRIFYCTDGDNKGRIFRFTNGFCKDSIYIVFTPDIAFYKYYHQKKQCPLCLEVKNITPIVYGLPSKTMMREAKKGRISLGGCIVTENQPEFYCKKDDFPF